MISRSRPGANQTAGGAFHAFAKPDGFGAFRQSARRIVVGADGAGFVDYLIAGAMGGAEIDAQAEAGRLLRRVGAFLDRVGPGTVEQRDDRQRRGDAVWISRAGGRCGSAGIRRTWRGSPRVQVSLGLSAWRSQSSSGLTDRTIRPGCSGTGIDHRLVDAPEGDHVELPFTRLGVCWLRGARSSAGFKRGIGEPSPV